MLVVVVLLLLLPFLRRPVVVVAVVVVTSGLPTLFLVTFSMVHHGSVTVSVLTRKRSNGQRRG